MEKTLQDMFMGIFETPVFSSTVNGKTVKRLERAEDGELISMEHDKAMDLYYLFT